MNNSPAKSKRKFNIIDLLIILAVLVCILFAANVIVNDLLVSGNQKIEYVIKISDAEPNAKYSFNIGDKVFAGKSNTHIGSISNISAENAGATTFDYNSGRFTKTSISGKYDVYITVSAICSLRDNIYQIGDIQIISNTNPEFNFPFSYENAEIIQVNQIQSDD